MSDTQTQPKNRKRWLWYSLSIAAVPVAILLTLLIPNAAGQHADGHMFSAVEYAVQVLVVLVLAFVNRNILGRWLLAVLVLPIAGVVYGSFASAKISYLIWHKNWNDENAGSLGQSVPGFGHWHELAEQADIIIAVGGIAFAIAILLLRRAGNVAPIAAIVLSLVPAWIFPALGCSFLLAYIAARNTPPQKTAAIS